MEKKCGTGAGGGRNLAVLKKANGKENIGRVEWRSSRMIKHKFNNSECGHKLQRGNQSGDEPSTSRIVLSCLDTAEPSLRREPGEDRRSWRCCHAESTYLPVDLSATQNIGSC